MKHNSKRRMIAILLVVAMVLAMLPSPAFASVDDELWVNGEDIFLAKDNTVQCGNGTATYNPSTFTLTLNNATIDKKYQSY
ncbi:MAG: hypothetical protein RSB75_01555, partial [Anaerovoracaceae bacterium]